VCVCVSSVPSLSFFSLFLLHVPFKTYHTNTTAMQIQYNANTNTNLPLVQYSPKQMIIPQTAGGIAFLLAVYTILTCEFIQTQQTYDGFEPTNTKTQFSVGLYSRESPVLNDHSCVWFDEDDFEILYDAHFFLAVAGNSISGAIGLLNLLFSLFMWFCPCSTRRWSIVVQTSFYFFCFLCACFSQAIYWAEACKEDKCNVEPDGSVGSLCFQSTCSVDKGSILSGFAACFWLLASILTYRLRSRCLPPRKVQRKNSKKSLQSRMWARRGEGGHEEGSMSTRGHCYLGLEECLHDLEHNIDVDDLAIDDLSNLIDEDGEISFSMLEYAPCRHNDVESCDKKVDKVPKCIIPGVSLSPTKCDASTVTSTIQTEDESASASPASASASATIAASRTADDGMVSTSINGGNENKEFSLEDIVVGNQMSISPLKGEMEDSTEDKTMGRGVIMDTATYKETKDGTNISCNLLKQFDDEIDEDGRSLKEGDGVDSDLIDQKDSIVKNPGKDNNSVRGHAPVGTNDSEEEGILETQKMSSDNYAVTSLVDQFLGEDSAESIRSTCRENISKDPRADGQESSDISSPSPPATLADTTGEVNEGAAKAYGTSILLGVMGTDDLEPKAQTLSASLHTDDSGNEKDESTRSVRPSFMDTIFQSTHRENISKDPRADGQESLDISSPSPPATLADTTGEVNEGAAKARGTSILLGVMGTDDLEPKAQTLSSSLHTDDSGNEKDESSTRTRSVRPSFMDTIFQTSSKTAITRQWKNKFEFTLMTSQKDVPQDLHDTAGRRLRSPSRSSDAQE
jgi:hypothetical protein